MPQSPVLFVEAIESDDTHYAVDGYDLRRDRVRVFHTQYTTAGAAENDSRMPKIYDLHPQDTLSWCISKEARHVSDGFVDIICHYRWTGEGGIPEKGFSVKIAKVSLPIFYLHSKIINPSAQLTHAWEPADSKYTDIEEQYLVYTFGRRIPKLTPDDINLIVNQHRHLHVINNIHYMFMPPIVISIDQVTDHITYNWIHDNGTLSPRHLNDGNAGDFGFPTDPRLFFPADLPQLAQDNLIRIRDPYKYLVPLFPDPVIEGTPPPPTIVQISSAINLQADYSAWRGLPGMFDQ